MADQVLTFCTYHGIIVSDWQIGSTKVADNEKAGMREEDPYPSIIKQEGPGLQKTSP